MPRTNLGPSESRVLVIGCGSIGKRHIRNLLAVGARDVLCVDPSQRRRDEVADAFGLDARAELDDAWDWAPDVAFITAPTSLHVSLALRAAEHGCHLFIEKPLSHSRDGVRRLEKLAREMNLVTLVGCNMRFHPGLRTLKRLVQEGRAGTIVAARVEVGQYLPDWRPTEDYRDSYSAKTELGGGIVLDAIHEIDYIRWLLGEVVEVACMADRLSHLEIETEDTAGILFRFASGAIGELHLDYVQRSYSRSCRIIGDEGTLEWDYEAGETRAYSADSSVWDVYPVDEGWKANSMYLNELSHYFECLSGNAESEQDVKEGARVLDLALAAKESAAAGRFVDVRT